VRLTMEELYRRLVMAESRVTSLERQLAIDLGTGLISINGRIYAWVSMPGRVRLATAPPLVLPIACRLVEQRIDMTTASSSGSVTYRSNIGASDYDTTATATNTTATTTHNVTLAANTAVVPEITAAGTTAEDLSVRLTFVPT